jgi:phosphatidylserine synthase
MALILVLSYLMISNVRYRTFKQVRVSPASLAAFVALLATFTTLALVFQPALALLVFFGGYVSVGLIEQALGLVRRGINPSGRQNTADVAETRAKGAQNEPPAPTVKNDN